MKNKLQFDVTSEDQVYVEGVCTAQNFTFETFFKHLLDLYKKSLNDTVSDLRTETDLEEAFKEHKAEKRKQKTKK